jgi:hypothetical protein
MVRDVHEHFFELEELAGLSLADLQTLWDSVATEDQSYLVRIFEREADKRQIVEDLDEARMARYFLDQYRELAFVPAGDVWVKVPPAMREQYKLPLREGVTAEAELDGGQPATPKKRSFPKWIFWLAIPFVCMVIFLLVRLASGTGANPSRRVPTPTVTPSPTATLTPTVTPTAVPPTATPFALAGFDAAITAGERANRDYYPVQLQIFPDRDTPPRVFIVQQQVVGVAEWQYDPNPDVVSWLRGMVVRPVLGVPFSRSNLDLFRSLKTDSVFVVTMNTGEVKQFVYQNTRQVARADTTLFQQTAPGLVLVLMGETFADGSPTDLRYVVQGNYPADQEIGGGNQSATAVIPMQTAHLLGDLTVTVQSARLVSSATLPPELAYALLDVQLESAANPVSLASWTWLLELTTAPGERYAPDVSAGNLGNCAPLPATLNPNTATCASVGFLVSRYAEQGRLWLGADPTALTAFQVQLDPLPIMVGVANLEVQLGRITYTDTALTVKVRLYNPTDTDIAIAAQDFGLILGFVPNPTGTTLYPLLPTQSLAPQATRDLTLEFPYSGEGYAVLTLVGHVWAMQVRRS